MKINIENYAWLHKWKIISILKMTSVLYHLMNLKHVNALKLWIILTFLLNLKENYIFCTKTVHCNSYFLHLKNSLFYIPDLIFMIQCIYIHSKHWKIKKSQLPQCYPTKCIFISGSQLNLELNWIQSKFGTTALLCTFYLNNDVWEQSEYSIRSVSY